MMGDLIFRRLRWGLLWRVKNKIKAPNATIRWKISDAIDKQVKVLVEAACAAAWKTCCESRDKIRPDLEAKIKENGAPIFEAVAKMKSSVQDKLMEVLNPIIDKTANPLVEKVLSKAFDPIADAHVEALKGFKRCFDWYKSYDGKEGISESTIRRMNWWVSWYLWESRHIMYKIQSDEVVRKALTPPSSGESSGPNDAGEKEEEPSNSNLAYKINDQLEDQVLAAIWTLGKDKDVNVVAGKFANDSKILLREQYKAFLLGVVQPNIMPLASKTVLELAKPIDDALPDLLKNFINCNDVCVDIIKNVCDQIAEKFTDAAYPKEAERMEAALKQVFSAETTKA
jgi:predicted transcriptional regulator